MLNPLDTEFFLDPCLVAILRQNGRRIFIQFSGDIGHDTKTIGYTVLRLTRLFRDPKPRRGGVSVWDITEKYDNGFIRNFQDRLNVIQGPVWNSLGIFWGIPWIQIFSYSLDPCLLAILRTNCCMDFHEIFRIRRTENKELSARPFHTRLDCFIPLKLVAVEIRVLWVLLFLL